jgi:hypothetical protein
MLPVGVPGEVLAEIAVPAAALPDGETAAMLALFTWQPNTTSEVPAGTFEKGILVDVLMDGSYAMRSGGPLLVAREGNAASLEDVAAEEETVLATGDAVLYLENDAHWVFRNADPAHPGMAIEALIISTDPPALPVESVVDPEHVDEDPSLHLEVLARTVPPAWKDGAAGPLTLTIWRAELAPDTAIAAPADGVVQLIAPESGEAPDLAVSPDGSARNSGQAPVTVVGLTVTS